MSAGSGEGTPSGGQMEKKEKTKQKPNARCACGSGKKFKKCCGSKKMKTSGCSSLSLSAPPAPTAAASATAGPVTAASAPAAAYKIGTETQTHFVDDDVCAICLEPLRTWGQNTNTRMVCCGKTIHKRCIEKWVRAGMTPEALQAEQPTKPLVFPDGKCCPMCRTAIGDINCITEQLKEWVRRGKAWAMCQLGGQYYRGIGVEQSYEQAHVLWRQSAELGYPQAHMQMGNLYYFGQGGCEKSAEKAREWIKSAASLGNGNARYNLALKYLHGEGGEQSNEKAIERFAGLAAEGDERSACQIVILSQSQEEKDMAVQGVIEQGTIEAQARFGYYLQSTAGEKGEQGPREVAMFKYAQALFESVCKKMLGEDGHLIEPRSAVPVEIECVSNSALGMGIMALQGQGMPQSDKVAQAFFMLSMRMGGNDVAAHNLKMMLRAQTRNC